MILHIIFQVWVQERQFAKVFLSFREVNCYGNSKNKQLHSKLISRNIFKWEVRQCNVHTRCTYICRYITLGKCLHYSVTSKPSKLQMFLGNLMKYYGKSITMQNHLLLNIQKYSTTYSCLQVSWKQKAIDCKMICIWWFSLKLINISS